MRKWNHRGRNTDPKAGDSSQLRADVAQVEVQVQEEECKLGTRGSVNAGADEEMVESGSGAALASPHVRVSAASGRIWSTHQLGKEPGHPRLRSCREVNAICAE